MRSFYHKDKSENLNTNTIFYQNCWEKMHLYPAGKKKQGPINPYRGQVCTHPSTEVGGGGCGYQRQLNRWLAFLIKVWLGIAEPKALKSNSGFPQS